MSLFELADIVGAFPLTSASTAPVIESNTTAMRVAFNARNRNIIDIKSARICIVTINKIKLLVVNYTTQSGFEKTVAQIPLLGQTFADLARSLNDIAGLEAIVSNNYYGVDAKNLVEIGYSNILDQYVYLSADVNDRYQSVANIKNSLQLFYTAVEPFANLQNFNQSYGGHITTNQIYYGYQLAESLGIYADKIVMNFNLRTTEDSRAFDMTIPTFQKAEFLQINDEIIQIAEWQNEIGYIKQRNVFETPLRVHAVGSLVKPIYKNTNFDKRFGSNRKQYRCFALKNINSEFTIKNVSLYSSLRNRNYNSQMRLALEIPRNQIFQGSCSSNGITAFSCTELINAYLPNYFVNAPLQFTSGKNIKQIRFVKSYIPSTGTIELDVRLPYTIEINDKFIINPQPSIRMKNWYTQPTGSAISNFLNIPMAENALSLQELLPARANSHMLPNEVIYLWIERSIQPQSDEYNSNRLAIGFYFSGT